MARAHVPVAQATIRADPERVAREARAGLNLGVAVSLNPNLNNPDAASRPISLSRKDKDQLFVRLSRSRSSPAPGSRNVKGERWPPSTSTPATPSTPSV